MRARIVILKKKQKKTNVQLAEIVAVSNHAPLIYTCNSWYRSKKNRCNSRGPVVLSPVRGVLQVEYGPVGLGT